MLTPSEYYQDPEVRERIAEYCGGSAREPEQFSAEYVVGYGEALLGIPAPEPYISQPKSGFGEMLNQGLDIFRSIWDRFHLLGLLDIEYFNLDYPGEIYLDQVTTFNKIEPVYRSILKIYQDYDIRPLTIMTGQGYHFSFQIQSGSQAALRLEDFGPLNDSLIKKYQQTIMAKRHREVSIRYGRGFHGLGRVMEFFCHRIMRETADQTYLPLLITDVAIGSGKHGREGISLDLSCFGDPVYMRDCRCAFSTHQKHKVQRYKVGDAIADGTPVQIAIPRKDLTLDGTISLRRHFQNAAEYARRVHCVIPNFTVNIKKLITDYQNSNLFRFHQWFDREKQHPPERWAETYDRLNLDELPPCVRKPLEQPNDLLLKPTNLQTLTRVLLAKGWHPQHIAGLVHSRWVNGPGWPPDQWKHFDAGSRSAFYVRIFSGLMADGLDDLVDHNCISHREKEYCPQPDCGFSLGDYRWDGKF